MRRVGRAGEGDPGYARIGNELRADFAVAGQELNHVAGDAGFMQQPHRRRCNQRCLLRRLGDDGVARGQRTRDLAEENRQRKIPRRDADEHAAAMQLEQIALAGRPRQLGRRDEFGTQPRSIVAAMIDRLAHFGEGIGDDAAAFTHDHGDEIRHLPIDEIGGAVEQARALFGRHALPTWCSTCGNSERALDLAVAGLADETRGAAAIGGVADLACCR